MPSPASALEATELTRRRRAAPLPPDARRSAIIDAAIPLLIARGESVKTADIARAAGIAEGTIFRVFETKEALIEAALERATDPGPLELAIAAVDRGPHRSLDAAVTDVVRILQRRLFESWQLISSVGPRFNRQTDKPRLDSAALAVLLDAYRSQLAMEPKVAARYLRAAAYAMTHPLLTERPVAPAEVARRFLYGVSREGAASREGAGRC